MTDYRTAPDEVRQAAIERAEHERWYNVVNPWYRSPRNPWERNWDHWMFRLFGGNVIVYLIWMAVLVRLAMIAAALVGVYAAAHFAIKYW
jgi:hypothetical protein